MWQRLKATNILDSGGSNNEIQGCWTVNKHNKPHLHTDSVMLFCMREKISARPFETKDESNYYVSLAHVPY